MSLALGGTGWESRARRKKSRLVGHDDPRHSLHSLARMLPSSTDRFERAPDDFMLQSVPDASPLRFALFYQIPGDGRTTVEFFETEEQRARRDHEIRKHVVGGATHAAVLRRPGFSGGRGLLFPLPPWFRTMSPSEQQFYMRAQLSETLVFVEAASSSRSQLARWPRCRREPPPSRGDIERGGGHVGRLGAKTPAQLPPEEEELDPRPTSSSE